MGKLFDCFDYVGLVCFTGYQDRIAELIPELKRVGLYQRVHFHWDFPSVFRDVLYSHTNKTPFCAKDGCFNMMVSHYNVIKTAYELNKKNILVMEDDIRFLRDLLLMEEMLMNIPPDYDMLLLDRSKPGDIDLQAYKDSTVNNGNGYWRRFEYGSSTGCYAMSRKGMKRYIDIIENIVKENRKLANPDAYFQVKRWGEEYWDSSYNRYFAYPSIAVQCITGRSGSHCSMKSYWEVNEEIGLKQNDYNIQMPIITRSNFVNQLYKYISSNNSRPKDINNILVPINTHRVVATKTGVQCDKSPKHREYQQCYIWGHGMSDGNIESLQTALRDDAEVVLMEDGFIRSCDTWCGKSIPRYKEAYSILFDTSAYYFDATRISNLEKMLNDFDLVITDEQRAEARRLIDKIVKNKVSKYNHQPINIPLIGRLGVPKVLVVDQSYGDFSIKLGLADDITFEKMLQKAIAENPEADIIVKTHPDTIAGKRGEKKGYYQDLQEHDNIYKMTEPINPYSLMDVCDKVYVCTSQFGIEALMTGKEVHVFGMPFYAGWGLTIDEQHLERRTNMRTIEELFYIFYCMYTHWVDPESQSITTIDKVIDKMILLREKYQRDPNKAVARPTNNGYVLGKQQAVRRTVHQELTISKRATLSSSRSSWL
jgi:capsular polysaccharide export protein